MPMRIGPGQTARIECANCGREVSHLRGLLDHQQMAHGRSVTPAPERILNLLYDRRERSAVEIASAIGVPTNQAVAHLQVLCEAELVARRYVNAAHHHRYRYSPDM